ncbi:hypothetical protein BST93_04355 [Nonlabens tegetincola]|nr:hypothetical protein BST93_04355 [Nonlabens tegetincola]
MVVEHSKSLEIQEWASTSLIGNFLLYKLGKDYGWDWIWIITLFISVFSLYLMLYSLKQYRKITFSWLFKTVLVICFTAYLFFNHLID